MCVSDMILELSIGRLIKDVIAEFRSGFTSLQSLLVGVFVFAKVTTEFIKKSMLPH